MLSLNDSIYIKVITPGIRLTEYLLSPCDRVLMPIKKIINLLETNVELEICDNSLVEELYLLIKNYNELAEKTNGKLKQAKVSEEFFEDLLGIKTEMELEKLSETNPLADYDNEYENDKYFKERFETITYKRKHGKKRKKIYDVFSAIEVENNQTNKYRDYSDIEIDTENTYESNDSYEDEDEE